MNLFRNVRRNGERASRSVRMHVESLEERAVPASATWNTGVTSNAWLTLANWAPATEIPGEQNNLASANSDVATIGTFAFTAASGLGINMSTAGGNFGLGGISFTSAMANLQIGNSSTTVNGVLTLNGATINSIDNTILSNTSGTSNLTIANAPTTGPTQTMGLGLGNTSNVIVANTARSIAISSNITERNANSAVTFQGGGTLNLSGTNSYTGGTTVQAGTLIFANTGAMPTTGTITVASGAALGLGVAMSGSFYTSANVDSLFAGTLAGVNNDPLSSVGIDTTPGTFTYSSNVAGTTRGLAKLGSNTLVLSGSNSYSGATTIAAGTLQISAANNLGDGSATNTVALGAAGILNSTSGTYNLGTNRAVSLITGSTLRVDAGTLTVDGAITGAGFTTAGAGNLTISGQLMTSGAVVTKTTGPAGTLTIANANNNFVLTGSSANREINGLTVITDGAAVLGSGGALYVGRTGANGNATLTIKGSASVSTLASTDLLVAYNDSGSNMTAALVGTLNLSESASLSVARDLKFARTTSSAAATNEITANVTVNTSGTLSVGRNLFIGTDFPGTNERAGSTFTLTAGTVNVTGNATVQGNGDNAKGAGTLNANGGAMTITGNLTISSTTNNKGSAATATIKNTIEVNGSTGVTLSGTGLGTSGQVLTISNGGNLKAKAITLSGANYALNLGSTTGGTITALASTASFLSVSGGGSGTITVGTGGITFDSGVFDIGISAALTGTGGKITKTGSGTLTLSNINSYTGSTTVSSGTLTVSGSGTLGSSTSPLSLNGGGLDLAATVDRTVGAVTVSAVADSGAAIRNGSLTAPSYAISNETGNVILSANLLGASATLSKNGAGTATLTGTNTYAGATTIRAGALIAGADAPASGNGAFGDSAGGAIVLGDASTAAGDAPSLLADGAVTVGRDIVVGSLANPAAYNATLGGSNTSGTSTFAGNISLNAAAAYTVTLQAAPGGSVDFTGTWTTNDQPIAIGSAGNTGTVRISSALSTAAAVNVNFGTLLVNDSITNASGVAVAGGATLGGGGSVAGTVLLNAASFIAPGVAAHSIGTLAVGGGITFTGTSTYSVDIGAGANNADKITVDGDIAIDGTLAVTAVSPDQPSYVIMTYEGTRTGTFTTVTGLPAGYVVDYATPNQVRIISATRATIGTIATTLSAAAIVAGGSAAFTFTVENSADLGFPDLQASAEAGTNTTGSVAGPIAVAAGATSGPISGLSFSSNTVGAGIVGNFSVIDPAASNISKIGSVAVDVFGHAYPVTQSLEPYELNLGNIHVGYTSPVVGIDTLDFDNGMNGDYIADLKGSAGVQNSVSLSTLSGIAPGDTGSISATLAPGRAAGPISESISYTFGDDSTLNGNNPNLLTANITVTGNVYTGVGVWNFNGNGNWNNFPNWTIAGGSPGLDPGFVDTDSATFGAALTSTPATVSLNGVNPSINALTFDNAAFAYTIAQGTSGTLTFNNGASAATLTGAAGSHSINAPITHFSDLAVAVTSASDTLTVSGAITEAGVRSLTKTGAGTLILSGTNVYTGATNVDAGTLRVNGDNSAATGTVTVAATATLTGDGVIGGIVSIASGGILAPGNGVGTLPLVAAPSLGGTADFEVTKGDGENGSADRVNVTAGAGTFTYGGTLKITGVGPNDFAVGDSWNLFDFVGMSQTGSFANNSVFGTAGDGTNLPVLASGQWLFDYASGILSIDNVVAPTVLSINPVIGPTTGGTLVTILGAHFAGTTSVTFGGFDAATFSVISGTQINAVAAAHVVGVVDVVVTNSFGSGSLAGTDDFTFAPSVSSVVVNGGPGVVFGASTFSLAGQHSVVRQLLVTFQEAVTVASDAFTVTRRTQNVTVNGGAAPSTVAVVANSVTMISASEYLVTFSGPGTHAGGVINSGVYDLTTLASKVTVGAQTMAANQTTTFFALFGNIEANNRYQGAPITQPIPQAGYSSGNGLTKAFVDPGSLFRFSDTFGSNVTNPVGPPAYDIVFDYNLDGSIDPGDLFAFSDSFGIDWVF